MSAAGANDPLAKLFSRFAAHCRRAACAPSGLRSIEPALLLLSYLCRWCWDISHLSPLS
jgi:hypothetical protein